MGVDLHRVNPGNAIIVIVKALRQRQGSQNAATVDAYQHSMIT